MASANRRQSQGCTIGSLKADFLYELVTIQLQSSDLGFDVTKLTTRRLR